MDRPAGRLHDGFRGALLGTAVGDALGMPLEGWPRSAIESDLGEVREMLDARLGAGTITDDTQMTIALAEALLESGDSGTIDLDRVAERFGARYEPERGYGGNTHRILAAIRGGRPWREAVGENLLPGGSFANGAAMRVAPVALAFYPEQENVARGAEAQAEVTGHTHPLGRAGARVQALAVLRCLEAADRNEQLDAGELLDRAGTGAPAELGRRLEWVGGNLDAPAVEAARVLGTGSRAAESVPAALWAFLSRRDDAEETIVRAVGLGGDTDTIGAMAGALAGAYHGASALPARWIEALEPGPDGRDRLVGLADELYGALGSRASR